MHWFKKTEGFGQHKRFIEPNWKEKKVTVLTLRISFAASTLIKPGPRPKFYLFLWLAHSLEHYWFFGPPLSVVHTAQMLAILL